MILATIKTRLKARHPRAFLALKRTWRAVRRPPPLASERAAQMIVERFGAVVNAGPFAGMRYVDAAIGSGLAPKLVGSYEEELHGWVTALCERGFSQVVNIGCGEGYYAVGLALRMPGAHVLAYDMDAVGQALCRQMAQLNGVASRVDVRGACSARELSRVMAAGALVVCDCEGAELDILDPAVAPGLRSATLLVELHDHLRPGVTPALEQRFSSTHGLEFTDSTAARDPARYPALAALEEPWRGYAAHDRPDPQRWLLLRPR